MEYIALLRKEGKSDYGVDFPDFPGCITAGKTPEEASRNAHEALALHIAGMKDDGESMPEPTRLDLVRRDSDVILPFLVSVESDLDQVRRINITARDSQIHEIDRRANLAHMTRSAFLVHEGTKGTVRLKKAKRRRKPR